jgi:hypothetical protein
MVVAMIYGRTEKLPNLSPRHNEVKEHLARKILRKAEENPPTKEGK